MAMAMPMVVVPMLKVVIVVVVVIVIVVMLLLIIVATNPMIGTAVRATVRGTKEEPRSEDSVEDRALGEVWEGIEPQLALRRLPAPADWERTGCRRVGPAECKGFHPSSSGDQKCRIR